jgi:hypothetical protein
MQERHECKESLLTITEGENPKGPVGQEDLLPKVGRDDNGKTTAECSCIRIFMTFFICASLIYLLWLAFV